MTWDFSERILPAEAHLKGGHRALALRPPFCGKIAEKRGRKGPVVSEKILLNWEPSFFAWSERGPESRGTQHLPPGARDPGTIPGEVRSRVETGGAECSANDPAPIRRYTRRGTRASRADFYGKFPMNIAEGYFGVPAVPSD